MQSYRTKSIPKSLLFAGFVNDNPFVTFHVSIGRTDKTAGNPEHSELPAADQPFRQLEMTAFSIFHLPHLMNPARAFP